MEKPTTSSEPLPLTPGMESFMKQFLTGSDPSPSMEPFGNKRAMPDNFQTQQASKKRVNMGAGGSTTGDQPGIVQYMRKANEVPVTKPAVGPGQMIKNLGQANPYQGGGNVYHIMNDPNIKNNRPQDEFYTSGFTTINPPLHKMNERFVPHYSGQYADFQDDQYEDEDGYGDEEEGENMVQKPKQQFAMTTKYQFAHEPMSSQSQNASEIKAPKSKTAPENKVPKSMTAPENKATKSKTVTENEGAKSKAVKEKKGVTPYKRHFYKPTDNVFVREERTPIEKSLDDGVSFIFGTDDIIAMVRWIITNKAWKITQKEKEFGQLLDQLGFTRSDLDVKIKRCLRTKTSAKLATIHGWMLKSGAIVHPNNDEKVVVFAPWIGEWMKPSWDGNLAIPAGVKVAPPPVKKRITSSKVTKPVAEEKGKELEVESE